MLLTQARQSNHKYCPLKRPELPGPNNLELRTSVIASAELSQSLSTIRKTKQNESKTKSFHTKEHSQYPLVSTAQKCLYKAFRCKCTVIFQTEPITKPQQQLSIRDYLLHPLQTNSHISKLQQLIPIYVPIPLQARIQFDYKKARRNFENNKNTLKVTMSHLKTQGRIYSLLQVTSYGIPTEQQHTKNTMLPLFPGKHKLPVMLSTEIQLCNLCKYLTNYRKLKTRTKPKPKISHHHSPEK